MTVKITDLEYDFKVVYEYEEDCWAVAESDDSDELRKFIDEHSDEWLTFYVKKSCMMDIEEFLGGSDNALAGYVQDTEENSAWLTVTI